MKKKVKRFSGRVASHTLAPLKMPEWLMRIDFIAVREDKAWLLSVVRVFGTGSGLK